MFDPDDCVLEMWCGTKNKPANYRRIGNRYECMKKGYGRGFWDFKKSILPEEDLEHIPYITRNNIQYLITERDINSLSDFVNLIRSFPNYIRTRDFLEIDLGYTTRKKFNSIVLFLFSKGIPRSKLPQCKN